MKCNYWGKVFYNAHKTCMLEHVLKISEYLATCLGKIPPEKYQCFLPHCHTNNGRKNKNQPLDKNATSLFLAQESASNALSVSHKKPFFSSWQMIIEPGLAKTLVKNGKCIFLLWKYTRQDSGINKVQKIDWKVPLFCNCFEFSIRIKWLWGYYLKIQVISQINRCTAWFWFSGNSQ